MHFRTEFRREDNMVESGKQKLRLLCIFLLLVGAFFLLEGKIAPGWKTGAAFLSISIFVGIDFYLEKGKLFRFFLAAFGSYFLFFAIKNFLAH